ncbi:hypothetical protein THRCLA_22104 [Thraustotheca clavata]|uniref:Uncharacterized protein n=1 Tax=Thraustotheca clavata TaxID=74557 RepID=A0A1V9ZC76_9STRA|nr:hypothetical protein THRCLA_22104 [Thraustotheca clavata]
MWKYYYRHYLNLAKNIGDPTSIILSNPVVSALFLVDFWINFVSRALFRVEQLVGITEFFIAYIYLSRTLWFAYGSLSVVSNVLKKIHCERYFHEIDPTLTAIVVAMIAGPFTFLQSQTKFFVEMYNFLFTFMIDEDHAIEASLASIIYTLTIGTLPVIFGFLPRHWFTCQFTIHL